MLLAKHGNTKIENRIFSPIILLYQSSTNRCVSSPVLLNCNSHACCCMAYDSVVMSSALDCWGPQLRRNEVESFAMQQLNCIARTM